MKIMCDKELLVGYLYDEIDPASRQGLEAHLTSCAACRDEVGQLRATRRHLAEWAPPDHDLGFQVVTVAARPRASRFRVSPVWGLAAAAVIVLAASAAIANVEVRYGADGMTVRTGWGRAPATQVADAAAAPAAVRADLAASIETIQRRLTELETSQAPVQGVVTQASLGPRVSDADLVRRMRALLTESESRQNRELALRIRQLAGDIDAQRRVDLSTIQQRLQGATDEEARAHRQLWEVAQGAYRVSQQSQSK